MNESKEPDMTFDAPSHADAESLDWKPRLRERIVRRDGEMLGEVQSALQSHPSDPELLLMAALAALFAERPDLSLRYEHRFSKRFVPIEAEGHLLRAIALAQQEHWAQAAQIMKQHGYGTLHGSFIYLPGNWALRTWVHNWLNKIERVEKQRSRQPAPKRGKEAVVTSSVKEGKTRKGAKGKRALANGKEEGATASSPEAAALQSQTETVGFVAGVPPLPRVEARIPVAVSLPEIFDVIRAADDASKRDLMAFRLRYELSHLGLLQGFDELLCLSTLRGVEAYWYQTEAVRKVLKQFRGRVLLADEVGLGKTIEAGMALKEYLMRGMARRVLILTPATLVGQWQEEMQTKFDVEFATSYDGLLLRRDPEVFWAQPRVIASIATARRAEHLPLLAAQNYDLVVVDEAHHLKNRQTQNWKLVNALQKRFLLLLSATPVQNSLVELYNLLTLLKPGIFKTEREFRQSYMTTGKPRVPANRERMRDLMRDVMIRNTRSLVDVHLPPRHATTLRLEPNAEEAACYQELTRLVREEHQHGSTPQRLALRHLLSAAGSHATTAAATIARYRTAHHVRQGWRTLQTRYAAIQQTSKEHALCDLLARNPD